MNPKPSNHLLLTYPRTASNLLIKILNLENQPNVYTTEATKDGYFFLPTIFPRLALYEANAPHLKDWTQETRDNYLAIHQSCFEALRNHADVAKSKGKFVIVKEHAPWMINPVSETELIYGEDDVGEKASAWTVKAFDQQTHSIGNQTIFPDEFLKQWTPTFLIRHPALAFPSNYRSRRDLDGPEVAEKEWKLRELDMTIKWSRNLYDWFLSQTGETPIILDADDIMTSPEIVGRYAKVIGVDPEKLRFSWASEDREIRGDETHAWKWKLKRMRDTLRASSGIVEGKTAIGLDVDEEVEKWKGEFGRGDADKLERWVKDAMGDYEYMKARRLI